MEISEVVRETSSVLEHALAPVARCVIAAILSLYVLGWHHARLWVPRLLRTLTAASGEEQWKVLERTGLDRLAPTLSLVLLVTFVYVIDTVMLGAGELLPVHFRYNQLACQFQALDEEFIELWQYYPHVDNPMDIMGIASKDADIVPEELHYYGVMKTILVRISYLKALLVIVLGACIAGLRLTFGPGPIGRLLIVVLGILAVGAVSFWQFKGAAQWAPTEMMDELLLSKKSVPPPSQESQAPGAFAKKVTWLRDHHRIQWCANLDLRAQLPDSY